MKRMIEIIGSVAVFLIACAPRNATAADEPINAEFVGSTLADTLPREFLGGLPTNAPCHYIKWQLTLSTNQNTGLPATYKLAAQYHIPARDHPNRSEDGPKVAA